ncbi:MAG: EF-hand domain-containing protein [Pseudomonadota bacterium]
MTRMPFNPAFKLALLAALCLGSAPPTQAVAQPMGAALLARLDTDGDNAISQAEAETARKALFVRIDRNGDQTLDIDEVHALRETIADLALMLDAMIALRARRMDADGNQLISAEEFDSGGRLFDLADRDGDGMVSAEELSQIAPRR